jgi:hypothetical protein
VRVVDFIGMRIESLESDRDAGAPAAFCIASMD